MALVGRPKTSESRKALSPRTSVPVPQETSLAPAAYFGGRRRRLRRPAARYSCFSSEPLATASGPTTSQLPANQDPASLSLSSALLSLYRAFEIFGPQLSNPRSISSADRPTRHPPSLAASLQVETAHQHSLSDLFLFSFSLFCVCL